MSNRKTVPPDEPERMRAELGLDPSDLSEAIGYTRGAYAQMLQRHEVSETAALAIECLVRRQPPPDAKRCRMVLLCMTGNGRIAAHDVGELQELLLRGDRYLLLPVPADE